MLVYPNPNIVNFSIEAQSTLTNVQYMIYDINGKLVLSQVLDNIATINASELSNGIYNICIISEEGTINKRVVIAK